MYLKKIYQILSSKITILLFCIILLFIIVNQCSNESRLESEVQREYNNYLAANDSIRTISNINGRLIQEKSAYEFTLAELTESNKKLISDLKLEKKKTPESIIEIVTVYKDSIINIPTTIENDSTGSRIRFEYNPTLPGKNKLSISGYTPYALDVYQNPSDGTNYLARIIPGLTVLSIEQNIELTAALYRDNKTKRLMARVMTEYPNIKFGEINAFTIIDNKETKKTLYSARKTFGIGINIGYGIIENNGILMPKPYIGIGLQYSPRFLQF